MMCVEDLFILAFVVCLSACTSTPVSQPGPSDGEQAGSGTLETISPTTVTVSAEMMEDVERTSEGHPKLQSSLNQLLDTYQQEGLAKAQVFAQAHQIALEEGRAQVVVVTNAEAMPAIRKAIETLGGEYESHLDPRQPPPHWWAASTR
jgi:hypothetical protein